MFVETICLEFEHLSWIFAIFWGVGIQKKLFLSNQNKSLCD